jgi:hypothetical protein
MRMRLVRFCHVPHGRVEKFERASPHDHPVIAPLSLSLGDCGFGAGWLRSFCVRPQACTRARPGVSVVRTCPVYAAVASILGVAMASLPVSDSRERPKQRDAIGDPIFGNNFFDCFWFTHFLLSTLPTRVQRLVSGNRLSTAPRYSTPPDLRLRADSAHLPAGERLARTQAPSDYSTWGRVLRAQGHAPTLHRMFLHGIVTCAATCSRCNARLESVVTCQLQVRRSRFCARTWNMVARVRAPSHLGTARALLPCAKACSGYEELFPSGRCQQRVRVTQKQHAPKSTAAHHAPRCMPRP